MPSIKRIAAAAAAAIVAFSALATTSFADEPYTGYNYDWWGDPVPSQNGYVVDKVVSGVDLGIGALTEPSDMFFSDNEELFIVDTSYKDANNSALKGRIVITDSRIKEVRGIIRQLDFSGAKNWLNKREEAKNNGSLSESDYNKTTNIYFNGPTGVFVDRDNVIYVADKDNDRVVSMTYDGNSEGIAKVITVYTRPNADVYDPSTTFNPSKVLVDAAGNVYICIKSITKGACVFAKEGDFSGYFGANRVEQTAEVILNAFWKLIFSREQIAAMRRSVPVEISNFDIDSDNFVYTVTESKSANTDVLKKLNSAGTNIFTNLGYSDYTFGDFLTKYYRGQTYSSQITDVDIGPSGEINLLDLRTGRVFQYDDECNLLFIFGGIGAQKGTFTIVNAVESLGTDVYVLDGRKCSITIFKQTEFGSIVHEAIALFNKGKYDEALQPWEEVIRRDSNYWLAYIGIGNAYLNKGEYETAMKYFYYNSRTGYNDAFKGWRMDFIRDNFTLFAVIILVLLMLIYVISSVRQRQRIKKRMEAEKLYKEQQKKKGED